jgi:tetratricopeptide (TPR) repeat protein
MSGLAAIAVAVALSVAVPVAPTPIADAEHDAQEAIKHYRAGKDALAHEQFEHAEQEFRHAVRLDPLLVAAHHGLGQTKMATKQYREAVDAFLAAREAFNQGQALAASNEMSNERRLDEQIRALQDDVAIARRQSSGASASSIQAAILRNEDQIKTLQSLRRRGGEGPLPTPHWLSFALGSAYFRAGDLVKAEAEYRAALKEKADLGEGHLNLAVVCMLTGRLDEATAEVALAEKAGVKVPQGLKDEIKKRRAAQP